MKRNNLVIGSICLSGLLALGSCNNATQQQDDNAIVKVDSASAPLNIVEVNDSPEFPDAALSLKNFTSELKGADSVTITFNYEVKNYELKNQTNDAGSKNCNNSKDGQHIHFILDNTPYAALYEPTKTFTVALNSEHYVMSFLSRSYHESVKSPNAGFLFKFKVDDKGTVTKMDNPTTPMLFYSRPKGTYVGEDTKNILLDFYVVNAPISSTGHKVKATINGTDFSIDQWKPYFIQNAPMGNLSVTLQLTDKDGNPLSGDNAKIERTVELAAAEPIK